MLYRMNHKIIEAWLSSICGVFGFGIAWTSINWADALPKISLAALSAAVAGGMGYIGKLITVWALRKCKILIHSLKKYIMDPNNPLWLFLQEIVLRFRSKSPKTFVIIQWLSGVTAAITGLPGAIQALGLALPPAATFFESKIVAAATTASLIMARLPIMSKPIAVTADGVLLKQANDVSAPFTAASEKKAALQQGLAGSATLKEVINSTNK